MTELTATDTVSHDYTDPVGQLLTLGAPPDDDPAKWLDYRRRFEFTNEHVPALIRMACDMSLHYRRRNVPAGYGHPGSTAWRTLGQLRCHRSGRTLLLTSMQALRESEAPYEELSHVYGMIGPAAIPPIAAYLADPTIHSSPACIAMSGLVEIVKRHPDRRDECVALLTEVLARAAGGNPATNGWIVATLLDFRAVEGDRYDQGGLPSGRAVDPSMAGDLEDVEIDLGFRKERTTKRKLYYQFRFGRFGQ